MNPDIQILGAIIGGFTIFSAAGVVTSKVPIHAAGFLILTLFGVAAEYVVLEAHTMAVFQVLVYAGAIVVLIAFVLMLMGSGPEDEKPVLMRRWQTWVGLVLGLGILSTLVYALTSVEMESATRVNTETFGQIDGLGRALLSGYVFPFEIISLLLMAAIVGVVALLRKRPTSDEGEVER